MTINRIELIGFYKGQLKKFKKLGLGAKTEFGVTVTDTLIEATKRRYFELTGLRFLKKQGNSNNGTA
jgi:hypothetical protein